MQDEDLHPLRRWRMDKGLTLGEAAALLSSSPSALSAYENGRKIPRPAVMQRIRARTDRIVTPNDFYPEPAE